jgi:hypothetical protein
VTNGAPHLFRLLCCAQALVDSPTETRKVVGFKRLALTDLKVDIKRVPGKTELTKAFTEAGETAQQAAQWEQHQSSSTWPAVASQAQAD